MNKKYYTDPPKIWSIVVWCIFCLFAGLCVFMTPAKEGLEAIKWDNAEVHVYSDSSYVVNAINKGWLEGWQRKGFAKVKNPDLWQRFVPLLRKHRVAFHWIKGHAGHPENERCDALAVAAGAGAVAAGVQLPQDPGYQPDEPGLL